MVAYLNLLRPGLPREVLGYLNCDFRCLAERSDLDRLELVEENLRQVYEELCRLVGGNTNYVVFGVQ